ncbi:Beta-glucosidase [Streptomyces albus]|uniref:Beta-glucosidase n=2 Tax=Streptomyces TaxID=1883 RepID=A0A0B5ELK7_STRA4|nr:Beta-glucosidase [Streptomyces albus]AOU76728.1 Beta-glucosidase [Streptomyces albus]AYN32508.1 Beta-glucosidase [Streptomyces albus]
MTPTDPMPRFPDGFAWGVGAASFQTEGAVDEDGRGPSIWDTFCARPGRIANGDAALVATDFYRRYREDIALVRELGVDVYRISVAWPRVVPDGTGPVNPKGLDFYDRVVDALCAAGLDPALTLYHWDLPQPLEDAGGWLTRETAEHFARYAEAVAERLADRVAYWIPLNEPVVQTMLGYAIGEHAPGRSLLFEALPTAHHQLLAHGLGVGALRAAGARRIGTANPHAPQRPASALPEDLAAAELSDALWNRLWSDPILTGRYPEGYAAAMPGPVERDLATISAPLDFYGVNYYSPTTVGAPMPGRSREMNGYRLPEDAPFVTVDSGLPRTGLGGDADPSGLYETLLTLTKRYGELLPPLIVTENGTSQRPGTEEPGPDGRIHDRGRIAYLDAHVRALHAALREGADVRGYWHWSPTDNFEWSHGFVQRFGLVHVDYESLARTPKDSYYWYRRLVKGELAS